MLHFQLDPGSIPAASTSVTRAPTEGSVAAGFSAAVGAGTWVVTEGLGVSARVAAVAIVVVAGEVTVVVAIVVLM